MEMIYRGYPQALAYKSLEIEERQVAMQNVAPQPYMIYNREVQNPAPGPWDNWRRLWTEFEYFRGLYPLAVRRLQQVVDAEFDRIDAPGGAMYDEYPDREFLYRLRDRMLLEALALGIQADRDMIHVLLLQELLRRRMLRIR
ncbi:MAG: hypothetical protein IJ374_06925 [Lachnospiraceae bacterium]|nr:hypothetical protein [Lachnospiraceae bacterium]